MGAITVVIEYKDGDTLPTFGANMEVLGGVVTAVQFSDALAELERSMDAIKLFESAFAAGEVYARGFAAQILLGSACEKSRAIIAKTDQLIG